MGRLLAIDYGSKRCGIAVTDLDQVFAFGHDTVLTSDLLDYLIDYTQKENVAGIVVGMPKQSSSRPHLALGVRDSCCWQSSLG